MTKIAISKTNPAFAAAVKLEMAAKKERFEKIWKVLGIATRAFPGGN